ncbi:hypothetical protein [Microbacterium sp. E-13]|uniref:hypothetical protein n=1 Tax=Microbacterium sp. E-13 TaxID=3404048 RepID=UPI003CEE5C2E
MGDLRAVGPAFDPRAVLEAALPDDLEWDEREVVLLGVLERQARHIAALEAELATHGYLDTGSKGQVRVSPLVSELRLQYAAMARVAEAIRLPGEAEKPKAVRHQRAARRRWDRA